MVEDLWLSVVVHRGQRSFSFEIKLTSNTLVIANPEKSVILAILDHTEDRSENDH